MDIETGLFDRMVLQRDSRNLSNAKITGRTSANGDVRVRVTSGKSKTLPKFANAKIGTARKGAFEATLKGIPVGGPYTIELSIGEGAGADKSKVSDVLVGDVWILGGQSNMQGCGNLKDRAKPDRLVRAFYMHDEWETAQDPIHNLGAAVDDVHHDYGVPRQSVKDSLKSSGVGPGVAFGQEMRRITGVPQGLIACAHGGTSMAQWDPAMKVQGTKSLYGAMVRRLKKNGVNVAGAVWYQGESDASSATAPLYTARMKTMVASIRRDVGDRAMPFVLVQIGRVVAWGEVHTWNSIQDQQRRLPEVINLCATVPAIDLGLDDPIHISGVDQDRLGKRLAGAMATLKRLKSAPKPPIAVKRITLEKNPTLLTANVIVEFDNVVGSLRAGASLATGFEVSDGGIERNVFHVDLDGNKATVRTAMPLGDVVTRSLHYGLGSFPACNITDEADRSLPVFGPIKLGVPTATSGYPRAMEVSQLLPGAGQLHEVTYPSNGNGVTYRKLEFTERFSQVRTEIAATAPEDRLIYYRYPIECEEPMQLDILLGYDGPVKMWWDGEDKFHDPNGTNPAVPDAKRIRVSASAGHHEIVIALGSNDGKAWGVFLKIVRRDVPARLLKKGPEHYKLPKAMV